MNSRRVTGKACSIPVGLLYGNLISLLVTMVLSVLLAFLLDHEKIKWDVIGYGILFTILISSYVGSKASHRKIKRQQLLVCSMSGLLYWGTLLLITALFFGGKYEAVGVTGLLVAGGSVCAGITGNRNKKYIKQHPKQIRSW